MKSSRNFSAVALIALVLAGPALAGEPAAPAGAPKVPAPEGPGATPGAAPGGKLRLTLEEAIQRARATQERIGVARSAYERADAAVGEAFSGSLPVLSANGSLTRSDTERNPTTGLPGRNNDYSTLYSSSLQLTQPLFTGGAVTYGVQAAKARRGAAAADLRTSQQVTIFSAAQDYYDAVLAREVLNVVKNSHDLAKRHYEDQVTRKKVGTVSDFDVLRAKVSMQNQEAQVINADNAMRLAHAKLLREIGLPQETQLELVTDFGAVGPAPSLAEARRTALARRPELAAAKLNTRAQRSTVSATRSGYLPKVSGVGTWGGTASERPLQDDNFTEAGTLGVQLQWTIFDGALTRARVVEAKADLARLEYQEQGLRNDVELQIRQALLNLESARTFIASQGANVEEAKEALRLAEARQKAGAGTELEIEDARNALEQAQLNYVTSVYQYSTARLALDQATGVLEAARR